MAGISDQAIKTQYAVNKYRFQKQELQNKEFSDGSGLEMYQFKYRIDDPQIGRFWSIDPLANEYEYNSPYAFSEDKVTGHIELEGLEAIPLPLVWGAAAAAGASGAAAVTGSGSSENTMGPGEAMVAATGAFFGGAWNGMVKAYDMLFGSSPSSPTATTTPGAPSAPTTTATPGAPSAPTATNPSAPGTAETQGSGEGRGVNNRKPDPNATGDHTVSNNRGSTTYEKNAKNPTGFQEVKRVDTKGASHGGVQTPHVHEDGKVRPAKPDEIPKTDLSKNKPSQSS